MSSLHIKSFFFSTVFVGEATLHRLRIPASLMQVFSIVLELNKFISSSFAVRWCPEQRRVALAAKLNQLN